MKQSSDKKRAVGYCRTSGEGQRDNTSIPTQKNAIEEYCRRTGWRFIAHYVDESKSGAKIAGPQVRIVPTKGLTRPYALTFLPDGAMLITERPGRLRIVRDGLLDPQPIKGLPEVFDRQFKGLNDIALHPQFAQNRWVYFTYYKPRPEARDVNRGFAGQYTRHVMIHSASALILITLLLPVLKTQAQTA